MVRKERFHCNRCARRFLTEDALIRHYDRHPDHSDPVTLDARKLTEKGTMLEDTEWVELDDRVETFLNVAETVDEEGLEMTYRPEEGTIVVRGVVDQTINVDRMQDLASENLQWSFDGGYHRITFLKEE